MKQEGEQASFKMGVKRWLKEQNLDYKWMADQCGVSEITVRNWMSQKTIPPLKRQLIERVMVQMPVASTITSPSDLRPDIQVDASMSLTIKISPELYSQLEDKAARQGISLGEMVARVISDLANESVASHHSLKTRKVILPPKMQ